MMLLSLTLAGSAGAQEPADTTALAAQQYAPRAASARTAGPTFSQWVASQGLDKGVSDLSAAAEIYLPEPRLAYVRLSGTTNIPSNKRDVRRVWVEFYDGQGHYFRKPALMKGQGGYSLRFPKRNFSLQFCDGQWSEDGDTPDFCFGDWVSQDGFHVKAFYTDFSRGIGEVGYKLFARMVADRQPYPARQGVEADSRVRCVPDGFPCVVWLGEDFYGVCAWQLKKHRRNLGMKKSIATHINLDGDVSDTNLFDGRIDWSRFEARNPKDLYCQDGRPYDGNSPRELMGTNSPHYRLSEDSEDVAACKRRSAQVKEAVVALSRYKGELLALERKGVGEPQFRQAFEQRFNLESLIDYYVFFRVSMNGDGTLKNWQWFTYNGRQWMVTPYDLDQTFGITLYGFPRPATHTLSRIDTGPFPFINRHYEADVAARYAQLRCSGVLEGTLIQGIMQDWHDRVGPDWYAMEMERWPESPCYCPAICNKGWKVCDDWSVYNDTPAYSASTTYRRGDRCILHGRIWEATATVRGVQPYVRNSDVDTLERLLQWVDDRLAVMDSLYGYNPASGMASFPAAGRSAIVSVWSLSGQRLPMPAPGQLNVVRYADGTLRVVRY